MIIILYRRVTLYPRVNILYDTGQFSGEPELDPVRCRSPTEPESQSETTARGFSSCSLNPNRGCDRNRVPVNMRSNNCVSRPSRGRPVSGDGNWTDRLQLQEHLGALKLEFAIVGSTTRGPVLRHATNSRLEEPVLGQRIDTVSTKTVDWALKCWSWEYTGNSQTSRQATLRMRVPTPYTGSVTPTIIMFSCRSPIHVITRRMMIGLSIPVRMTMVPGVLSTNSTLIQLHNQLPYNRTNNVTWCHIQNGSSWSTHISLMNCRRLTALSFTQCHICQHWHKPIIPSRSLPQPGFPFSEAMINHF